jgi:hypothetical protein
MVQIIVVKIEGENVYSAKAVNYSVYATGVTYDALKKNMLKEMNVWAEEVVLPPFIESDLEFIDNTK